MFAVRTWRRSFASEGFRHSPDDEALYARLLSDRSLSARPLSCNLLHLVPRRGRFGETGPLQQVPAVKEHPGVREPRDAPGPAVVLDGLQGTVEVAHFHAVGKAVREVDDVAGRGELRRPGDVARDHVHVGLPGLQLGLHLLEVLGAGGGHLAPLDPYLPRCSSLKRLTNSRSPSAPLLLKAKTSTSP